MDPVSHRDPTTSGVCPGVFRRPHKRIMDATRKLRDFFECAKHDQLRWHERPILTAGNLWTLAECLTNYEPKNVNEELCEEWNSSKRDFFDPQTIYNQNNPQARNHIHRTFSRIIYKLVAFIKEIKLFDKLIPTMLTLLLATFDSNFHQLLTSSIKNLQNLTFVICVRNSIIMQICKK